MNKQQNGGFIINLRFVIPFGNEYGICTHLILAQSCAVAITSIKIILQLKEKENSFMSEIIEQDERVPDPDKEESKIE